MAGTGLESSSWKFLYLEPMYSSRVTQKMGLWYKDQINLCVPAGFKMGVLAFTQNHCQFIWQTVSSGIGFTLVYGSSFSLGWPAWVWWLKTSSYWLRFKWQEPSQPLALTGLGIGSPREEDVLWRWNSSVTPRGGHSRLRQNKGKHSAWRKTLRDFLCILKQKKWPDILPREHQSWKFLHSLQFCPELFF